MAASGRSQTSVPGHAGTPRPPQNALQSARDQLGRRHHVPPAWRRPSLPIPHRQTDRQKRTGPWRICRPALTWELRSRAAPPSRSVLRGVAGRLAALLQREDLGAIR